MKYAVRLTVFILLLSPLNAHGQYVCTGSNNTARCPPCYYNQTAPGHHGIVNGRRQVNVFIQGGTGTDSWDDPPGSQNTNSQIWAAVRDGRAMWNDAVDTTSNPGTTNRPPYQCNEAQAGGIADADVVIIRDPNVPYARADNTGHPRYVRINPTWAASLTAAELKAAVAHELGHPHGLSNANTSASGCSQATTIMNGLDDNLKPIVKAVQQRDVYQMNQSLNNPGNCCAGVTGNAPLEENPDCTDNDADGWCQEVDCDDWAPEYNDNCQPPPPPASCPDMGCNEGGGNQFPVDYCAYGPYGCPYPYFNVGSCCNIPPSPILIDVDGSGFQLTNASDGVMFDFHGIGTTVRISWTSANSTNAWLALDRNGNGVIDNGKELFGNITPQPTSSAPNGFIALAEYDLPANGGNSDGVIDQSDAVFSSLRLWQDTNHNGISEPAELLSLPLLDVDSVSLKYKESRKTDEYGNEFRFRGKVDGVKHSRVSRWAWDVFLRTVQ
jgi:hypothetical protein